MVFYIDSYLDNFDVIPFTTPGADKLSFSELEHILDAISAKKGSDMEKKSDLSDIEMK